MVGRVTSGLELLLVALLVWARFAYIPFGNTLSLLLLASVSLWSRGAGWRDIGLKRPASWPRRWGGESSWASQPRPSIFLWPLRCWCASPGVLPTCRDSGI